MFTEDELNEVALAARQVIADGLPLTGEKLAEALSAGNDTLDPPAIDLLVHNLLSTFDQEPDPGMSVINIGDASLDDLRRETQSNDLVIFDLRRPSGAACSTLQGGGEHRLGRATL